MNSRLRDDADIFDSGTPMRFRCASIFNAIGLQSRQRTSMRVQLDCKGAYFYVVGLVSLNQCWLYCCLFSSSLCTKVRERNWPHRRRCMCTLWIRCGPMHVVESTLRLAECSRQLVAVKSKCNETIRCAAAIRWREMLVNVCKLGISAALFLCQTNVSISIFSLLLAVPVCLCVCLCLVVFVRARDRYCECGSVGFWMCFRVAAETTTLRRINSFWLARDVLWVFSLHSTSSKVNRS